jgi:heme A synthase
LDWKKWVRQLHRWLAIAFTVTVVVVTVMAAAQEEPAEWVFLTPLLPLALLVFSGLYLFTLPYAAKWRGRRTAPVIDAS